MKLKMLIVFCTLLFLTACFEENMNNCPRKCNLQFVLYDKNGADIFPDHIFMVDLFLYDMEGWLTHHFQVNQEHLKTFQGIRLVIQPGTYQVIAWGNVQENSSIYKEEKSERIEDHYLKYTGIEKGDRIYYTAENFDRQNGMVKQYQVTVDEFYGFEGILEFISLYREVNIYVEHYTEYKNNERLPLYLTLDGMPDQYNFLLDKKTENRLYKHLTQEIEVEGRRMYTTSFVTGYFEYDTRGTLTLLSNRQQVVITELPLDALIDYLEIDMYDPYNRVINIYILFFEETIVSIELPWWITEEIKPQV